MDDPADRESTSLSKGSNTGGGGRGGSGGGGRGGSGGGGSGDESKGGGSKGSRSGERSLFDIYKPGQGHFTRLGTVVGGGLIVLFGGNFLYQQLIFDAEWAIWVRAIVPLIFLVGFGLLLFWAVYSNRRTGDFFIATEGEMKKVSWSSRNEIIGSTKVVIVVSLLIGLMLFLVDILCMLFFTAIDVFKGVGVRELLFGSG